MPAFKYIKVLLKICPGPKTAIVFRKSALKYFSYFFCIVKCRQKGERLWRYIQPILAAYRIGCICSQKDRWSCVFLFPNPCMILQLVNTGLLNVVVLSSSHSTSGDSWESAQRLSWIWWVSLLNSQKTDPTKTRREKSILCLLKN